MLGFLGDSDRPGFRRLYFTRDLDYYAEFRTDDVVRIESIPADQPPFPGDEATRLTLRRDATVEYTRVRTPHSIDEFDADVRLSRRGRSSIDGAASTLTARWRRSPTPIASSSPATAAARETPPATRASLPARRSLAMFAETSVPKRIW